MKLSEMVRLDKSPTRKVPGHLKDIVQQTAAVAKEWGKKSWHDGYYDGCEIRKTMLVRVREGRGDEVLEEI